MAYITPTNLIVENFPAIIDSTPIFSWTGSGLITYQMQINYLTNNFSNPTMDISGINAPVQEYELSPEFVLLQEGTYFARIRTADSSSWSDWSNVLEFVFYRYGPYPPIIDDVTNPADGFWQVITGTKQADLYIFIRNNEGDWIEVSYPSTITGTTWNYNMPLVGGKNYIEVISAIINSTTDGISLLVNTTIYLLVETPEIYNVWNAFDEFGLLLGLSRIPGENNSDYKTRLLDVYTSPANSTYLGLRRGIARELGLSYTDITIENLRDLADSNSSANILNDDGNAIGTKLEDYVDEVYAHNPMFFGNVISDESYWDNVDEESQGYTYLPHEWDPSASGIYGKWQRGGIGDNDDLWVSSPISSWNDTISSVSWYLPIHTGYFYAANPSGILSI